MRSMCAQIESRLAEPEGDPALISQRCWVEEQREEAAFHLLSVGDCRDAGEQWLVASGAHPIAESIDERGAAGSVRAVLIGAVDRERMVE